jgi:two-component system response regulator MprA
MAELVRPLVVDDDALIRYALETLLFEEGFEVRTAQDGMEALTLLHGWRPDVILLDLMMPQMDGWTFRAHQLAHPDVAKVPIVVLSGAHESKARAHELGAAAALSKPFELDDVVATVRRVIDGVRA